MKLDFDLFEDTLRPNMKDGKGTVITKVFKDENCRIMRGTLPPGSSIGMHTHTEDSEIFQIISGTATLICDGKEEVIEKGGTHYCPKGSTHTCMNNGEEDLVMLFVIF